MSSSMTGSSAFVRCGPSIGVNGPSAAAPKARPTTTAAASVRIVPLSRTVNMRRLPERVDELVEFRVQRMF